MSESKTSWPSYYLREHIIKSIVGGLKGVLGVDLKSEGEIEMRFDDDPTRQAIFNILGDITRGIRLTYILEES